MHDELLFASEPNEPAPADAALPAWKIAVIDDDEQVRATTRLVLGSLKVDGRPLELLEAGSAAEGIALFERHADIALALVDMVMEDESAGLRLVDDIRLRQGNRHVRLALRTGQPGQQTEEQLVAEHGLDDYREKTELSARKLRTLVVGAVRAWREIDALQSDFRWLEVLLAQVVERQVSGHAAHASGAAAISAALAQRFGLPAARCRQLHHAALLHDLGLAQTPEPEADALATFALLPVEGKKVLEAHALAGSRMLDPLATDEGRLAARLAREHHERWDGAGYPAGLAGEAIALESRLLAVANVIDVCLSAQPGQPAMAADAVRALLEDESGRAFDPAIATLAREHFDALHATRDAARGAP